MTQERPKEFEGRLAQGKDWREIVAWVGDLPPMPHIAQRAVSMVENPATSHNELSEILASDTALAARVLKIANSAMFSRQREITTLNQAIMLIGFKALKGIIVAATLRQMNKAFGSLEKLIWENSMCSAMSALVIAKKLKKNYTEEIFLLGLLHSLGQIVLLAQKDSAQDYERVLREIEENHLDYAAAEQLVFGFAHPLLGALVAKKWNFNAETCQAILHYRDALDAPKADNELEEKTAIIRMAEMVSHAAGIGSPTGYPNQIQDIKETGLFLGFDPASIDHAVEEIINGSLERFNGERHVYE